MNKICELGLRPEVIDAIGLYRDVLESMSRKDFNSLVSFFEKIKQYEVSGFGYRTINKSGFSVVFSTDINWLHIKQTVDFTKAMVKHMNAELFFVKQHNLKVITRSEVKKQTKYLKLLNQYKINNSIVYYLWNKNVIEVFYFVPNSSAPELNDLILNNIERLVSFAKEISPALSFIVASNIVQAKKIKIIEQEILNFVWRGGFVKHSEKIRKIFLAGEEMFLTTKEAECLLLLKNGCSNKYMAEKLCISEFTVKDRVNNLKQKMLVETREDLVKMIQNISLKCVNKFMDVA